MGLPACINRRYYNCYLYYQYNVNNFSTWNFQFFSTRMTKVEKIKIGVSFPNLVRSEDDMAESHIILPKIAKCTQIFLYIIL